MQIDWHISVQLCYACYMYAVSIRGPFVASHFDRAPCANNKRRHLHSGSTTTTNVMCVPIGMHGQTMCDDNRAPMAEQPHHLSRSTVAAVQTRDCSGRTAAVCSAGISLVPIDKRNTICWPGSHAQSAMADVESFAPSWRVRRPYTDV